MIPPTINPATPAIDPAIIYGVRSGGGSKLLFSVLLIELDMLIDYKNSIDDR
jgi:hypothetical protein